MGNKSDEDMQLIDLSMPQSVIVDDDLQFEFETNNCRMSTDGGAVSDEEVFVRKMGDDEVLDEIHICTTIS